MTHLLLEYDESVDAAYLTVSDEPWARQERLDDARGVNHTRSATQTPSPPIIGQQEVQLMDALVTQSEDVAWGAAVIAGTRVPVETLFDYLERGKTLFEFLDQFPTVDRQKALAILEMASQRVQAATG